MKRKTINAVAGAMGVLYGFLMMGTQVAVAQENLQQYEQQVTQTYQRVVGAVLKLYHYNDSTGDRRFTGSAVVVSPEGLVLTVAHVNVPDRVFLGRFPDGREVRVRGLGEINSLDAAMMQIEDPGRYPYVPLGRSVDLQHGQPVVSLGYAGSLQQDDPAPRLGFVVRTNSPSPSVGDSTTTMRSRRRAAGGDRLQTTSLMEPGDSGGAVFDLDGRLIGLRSSINYSLDANYEIPIDHYLMYWDVLRGGEEYRRAPDSLAISLASREPSVRADALESVGESAPFFVPYSDTTSALLAVSAARNPGVVSMRSVLGDSTSYVQGTVVDLAEFGVSTRAFRRKTYVISKSSMVGQTPEIVEGVRKPVPAKVLYRDEDRDLVLLEIPRQRNKKGYLLSQATDSIRADQIGTFVHAPLGDGRHKWSIIGSTAFAMPGISKYGYFGAALDEVDGHLVFARIQEDSPAGRAKLRAGMHLLRLDGDIVHSPADFVTRVQQKRPGDTVRVEYLPADRAHEVGESSGDAELAQPDWVEIVLGTRPLIAGNHIAERFEGGKSIVRDGFERVFAHDGRLHPQEVGGPLLDLEGRLYGINIARLSRTVTLALPVDEVRAFLEQAVSAIPRRR